MSGLANTETGLTLISRNDIHGCFSHYGGRDKETHVPVCLCLFLGVGSRVHMLVRVSHCICVCVHLLMSLVAMEVVLLDACDTVRV